MEERKVYAHGYFGWSEVIDVRETASFGLAITTKLIGDPRPTTSFTAISTNMLAFEPKRCHAYQWAATDDGANESAEALATLIDRFPMLANSSLLTTERIVERIRRSRLATVSV